MEAIGRRFQTLFKPWTDKEPTSGAMGVWKDTTFIRCKWPALDEPVALFAKGSSGLVVCGPPTPRNIIFPDDTVFPDIDVDAESAAWKAYCNHAPGRDYGRDDPKRNAVYLAEYERRKNKDPKATRSRTRKDALFLKRVEQGETYISGLSLEQAKLLASGRVTRDKLEETAEFVQQREPAKRFLLRRGKMLEKV